MICLYLLLVFVALSIFVVLCFLFCIQSFQSERRFVFCKKRMGERHFVFICHEKVPVNALFSFVFFCASVDLVDVCSEKREGRGGEYPS